MATIIAGTIVLLIIALAGYSVIRSRKKGGSCGSCEGCSGCGHSQKSECGNMAE